MSFRRSGAPANRRKRTAAGQQLTMATGWFPASRHREDALGFRSPDTVR
jgi:hypothetical protein